jgi:hypothetical protein
MSELFLNKLAYKLEFPCEGCFCKLEPIAIPEGHPIAFKIVHCDLHRSAPRLRNSLKFMMERIEDGTLIRNIASDEKSDWTLRMMHFVKDLTEAQAALYLSEVCGKCGHATHEPDKCELDD